MKLNEFFSKSERPVSEIDKQKYSDMAETNKQALSDAVYDAILDDDYLHKAYFLPLARKIKIAISKNTAKKSNFTLKWLPMVNQGCKYFYKKHELKGDPRKIFNKEFRMELCKKLANKFFDDISKDEYNLGI
jgi:hypothetical protein